MLLPLLLPALAALASAQSSVRDQFDCAMRQYAVEFAQSIQPFRSPQTFIDVAAALDGTPEKASGCNVSASINPTLSSSSPSRFPFLHATPKAPSAGGATFYVSLTGSDSGSGSVAAPFATLTRALAATHATPGTDTIVLRGGVYASQGTLVLLPGDSGLTITNYPGEEVWLSGGTPLTAATAAQWKAYNVSGGGPSPPPPAPPSWRGPFYNTTDVFAFAGGATLLQDTADWQTCQGLCQAKAGCSAWTWHDKDQGQFALNCFWRPDGVWDPQAGEGHVAGYKGVPPAPPPSPNVWSLALPGVTSVLGLRASDGSRLTRARYPNGFPETKGFMPPAVFRATSWTPQQTPRAPATQVDLPTSIVNRNTSVSFGQVYTAGIGGTCDRFQPNAGYWCSEHVQGGGSSIYSVPEAMQATQAVLPHLPYKDPRGAIIQTWRPGHWASWMYEVADYTWDGTTANFSLPFGGFQGSRGENEGEDTYIENVFEELDSPSEWFFDPSSSTLYLWFNASSGTAPPMDLVMTTKGFSHLFNITGTQANPVKGVTIQGLGMRDTAYTYMDPHSFPSGGDWTLERSAVVFIEGTEGTNVSGCIFERIDGNAVLLSAYNRNVSVTHNEFVWIGATAVALWGNTESSGSGNGDAVMPPGYGADGTAGNQPRFSLIAYNLCHELGIWEKQSSCYTQFKSAQNTLWRNIMFNQPRASINFNDGFGGGALMDGNLVFNTCRESGDHGPFNSWDRDPYLFTDPATGQVTTVKAFDTISHNFIIANYNSLGAIDNDDGSSYYHTFENFFVYGGGGLKDDFEGHDNIWERNVVAFPNSFFLHNGYGGVVGTPGRGVLDGHEHKFLANKCISEHDMQKGYVSPICSGRGKTVLANNTIYTPTGQAGECGVTLAAWQAQDPTNDPGSVALAYPPTLPTDIITWARQALQPM